MLTNVLVDRVIDGYEDYCVNNCPFMQIFQHEQTLEWGHLCMLGRPIVPLKRAENLYKRTDYCIKAQINYEALVKKAGVEE